MFESGVWHIDVQVKTTSGEFDVSAAGADLAEAARGAYLRLGSREACRQSGNFLGSKRRVGGVAELYAF